MTTVTGAGGARVVGIRAAEALLSPSAPFGGPPGVDLAGCSEFPGGKCLPGESPRACAERECLEETGLTVRGIELLLNRRFEYPHGTFDLHFWRCAPVDASQLAEDHQGFEWVPRHELSSRTFPEGNLPVVRLLMGGGLPTAGAA